MGMSNATIRVSFHLSPDLVFRLSEEILSCCFSWFRAEVDAAASCLQIGTHQMWTAELTVRAQLTLPVDH
jgi:hypothetical protein